MKIKMFEILELEALYEKIHNLSLPIRVVYKFSKFFDAVRKEKDFYNKTYQQLIDDYIVRDENGDLVYTDEARTMARIKDGKVEECNMKVAELMNMEVDFDFTDTFTLEELEMAVLTMDQMRPLLPFIKD